MPDKLTSWAMELQSIAQAGLHYGKDVFDKDRYQRVRDIAAEMMAEKTGLPVERVKTLFCADAGYQTPKIDTRAAVFQDGQILLVREKSGLWSLPGGWCDFDLSPAENTVKETREEAGLTVEVTRLIAVEDRKKHNQPLYAYNIVKIFFLCRALGGAFSPNIETTETAFFPESGLPPLALEKVTPEQISMCFSASRDPLWQPLFD